MKALPAPVPSIYEVQATRDRGNAARGASATFVTHNEAGKTTRMPVHLEEVAYIAPGQPHRTHWSGYGELLNLYFSEVLLQELREECGCQLPRLEPSYRFDPSVYEIGRLLMDEFVWSGGLPATMVDHATSLIARRFFRISERLARTETTGLLSLKRLQPAIDFLQASPEEQLTLSELARLCNSSTFHFARSFSARIGCAPFQFQCNLRLQKARELLVKTELSIEDVGCAVGVENPTQFSRSFRRHTGFAPREYRRLHIEQKP